MSLKTLFPIVCLGLAIPAAVHAQGQQQQPNNNEGQPTNSENPQGITDTQVKNRFWQASLGEGRYMVALERISAISRHQYLLDGSVKVDEVTIDALGQSLVRIYYLSPITDDMRGTSTGNAAARIVDRGRNLLDQKASRTGVNVDTMVVKKYPETTHAKTIEFRVQSSEALDALYKSVHTAWENGRGRQFTIR